MTKTCLMCKVEKSLDDFYPHQSTRDGRDTYCKLCTKERNKRKYDRVMQDPKLRAVRRAQTRITNAKWRKANPQKNHASERAYQDREPEKMHARWSLRGAVRRGNLVKPKVCSCCRQPTLANDLHGHHADYGKPLDVEWLCRECHGDRTRKARV